MDWDIVKIILIVVVAFFIFINMIIFPTVHYDTMGSIKRFEATKETVEMSRNSDVKLENAALTIKIIECNQWLKGMQYYNSTIWGIYIPDAVNKLQPMK